MVYCSEWVAASSLFAETNLNSIIILAIMKMIPPHSNLNILLERQSTNYFLIRQHQIWKVWHLALECFWLIISALQAPTLRCKRKQNANKPFGLFTHSSTIILGIPSRLPGSINYRRHRRVRSQQKVSHGSSAKQMRHSSNNHHIAVLVVRGRSHPEARRWRRWRDRTIWLIRHVLLRLTRAVELLAHCCLSSWCWMKIKINRSLTKRSQQQRG